MAADWQREIGTGYSIELCDHYCSYSLVIHITILYLSFALQFVKCDQLLVNPFTANPV